MKKKIIYFLNNIEGYLCAGMMIVMSIVVFWQVVCRFVLKSSLTWSEEFCRYLLVWISFLGGAYGVRTGAHLGVEAFMLLFPKKVQKVVRIIVDVLCIILCATIMKFGIDIVKTQLLRMQLSPAMRIPMAYMYMSVPVGMFLFIIRYLQKMWDDIKKFNEIELTEAEKLKQNAIKEDT